MNYKVSVQSMPSLALVGFFWVLCFNLVSTDIDDKYCTCNNIPRTKPTDGRILNGTRNGTEVLNYVALLYFRYDDLMPSSPDKKGSDYFYVPFCTGIIISQYYVLTAAHCLDAIEQEADLLSRFYISAGLDHQLNRTLVSPANYKRVESVHKFPGYTKNQSSEGTDVTNDIGIVRLRARFDFGTEAGVLPACILDEQDVRNLTKDRETYGPDLFLAGYGRTVITRPNDSMVSEGREPDDFANVTLVNPPFRSATHNFSYLQTNYLWLITAKQNETCSRNDTYCVYNDNASNCFGDSGGPLLWWHVHTLYVVGVQSGAERKVVNGVSYSCYPGVRSYVTQIYPYANWLSGFIGRNKCVVKFDN